MTRRRSLIAVLVVAVALATVALWPRTDAKTLTVTFERTVGLFEGSDVRIMGLKVGEVTDIAPGPDGVQVTLAYERRYDLPDDVVAVLVAPSVISDRFVQLTPSYVSGPSLPDGAKLGSSRTRSPVELDTTLETMTDLATALGPRGANRDGALDGAIETLAAMLRGNGEAAGQTLQDLAEVTGVLGENAPALGSAVTQLQRFTERLNRSEADFTTFSQRLAGVSSALAAEQDDLRTLLVTLAATLRRVETFVRANRSVLVGNVDRLGRLARVLLREREALVEILDIVPLAFTNLVETYDPNTGAVRSRANFSRIFGALDKAVCASLTKQPGLGAAEVDLLCAELGDFLAEVNAQ